ncbi:MAG: carboxypeptidase regulatory-like domain-containing protein [Deltaproteobacteria bacterium]|nr:carboxypeptidase regulatory-like domain-containing protein [Deltaproteobacteria bacterium]
MMYLRKINILWMVIVAALFMMASQAVAADKTVTLGTASGNVGATVSVPITIDDATGVGGVAFTIAYEADLFEFVGLEQAGNVITDPDADKNGEPDETYTTQQLQTNMFYQANDEGAPTSPTGHVMVAAAAANALTGTNVVLFNAQFKILGGSGTYPINLVKTIITNADAGYTSPTMIPVLVGTTTPDGQGNYTSTDFPVYTAALVAGGINVNATKYSISGTVTYEGGAAAAGSPVVLKRNTSVGYVFDAQTAADASGNYAFSNKVAGTYKILVTSNNPGYYSKTTDPFAVVDANVTQNIVLPAAQRLSATVSINSGYLPGMKVNVLSGSTVIGTYPVSAVTFQSPPLPLGTYTMKLVYGNLESDAFADGDTFDWTLTLRTISGAISGLTGTPTLTVAAGSVTGKLQKTTTVEGNAAYSIANLVPAGDYIVSVTGTGIPVTYYDGTTDITQATAVDISSSDATDKNFDFTAATQGTISGTVTEDSTPVSGIGVYAFETTTYALTSVSTNASGEYTLTLASGNYEVYVIKANNKIFYYADGGSTQSQAAATILAVTAGGGLSGKNIDLTECTNTLTGYVTYERTGGDPAANVIITATGTAGSAVAITGQDGAYSLAGLCAGTYQVEMNPLNNQYAIQQATVVVPDQATQNFIIDTGNTLDGTITESGTSTAINNAMIYLLDEQTGLLVNNRMYFSNGTGAYVIGDIPSGIYNVNVTHPAYQSYSDADVTIQSDMTKDIQLSKGYYFNVTVTDGDNADAPLAGALVIVTRTGETPAYAVTNASGNCKIYGLSNYSDYIVIAQKRGFERQSLTAQTPTTDGTGTGAISFSLVRPAALFSLSGTITSGCAGEPIEGAYVLVSSASKNFFTAATTNGSGYYSMTNLPQAGDYKFVVVPGGNLQIYVETAVDFTGSTSFTKDVTIPCGSTIDGTITRATGTATIYVFLYTEAGGFVDFTTADGNGDYAFAGLAAGNYKVLAVSSGNTPKWYDGKDTISTADTVAAGATGVDIALD